MLQDTVSAVGLSSAGVPAGETPINFETYRVRANPAGARHDFEQMIGQLVRAVRPGVAVSSVEANSGDWAGCCMNRMHDQPRLGPIYTVGMRPFVDPPKRSYQLDTICIARKYLYMDGHPSGRQNERS